MLHPSDEERLSAYFDEELSSDECAAVERLLLDNPAAREWLEQVEDLHTELRSLPRLRLEADFADGVMRRAEREMLLRPEPEPREHVSQERVGLELDAVERYRTEQYDTATHNGVPQHLDGAATQAGTAAAHRGAAAGRNGVAVPLAANLAAIDANVGELSPVPKGRLTPARPQRWHAPAWLAAAASLLLFTGVLSLGTSEHNWAKAPASAVDGRMARGLRRSPGPHDRRSAIVLASPSDDARRRDKSLEKQNEMQLGDRGKRSESRPSLPQKESSTEALLAEQHAPAAKGDGTSQAADRMGEDASDGRAAATGGGARGLGALAKSAAPGGAKFGEASPDYDAKSATNAKPFSGSTADTTTYGAVTDSTAMHRTVTEEASLSFFAGNVAANAPANAMPASVLIVDVDGAPSEAFEQIEQALRRDPRSTDAYRSANRDNQGLGANAVDRLTLQAVPGQRVVGPNVAGSKAAEQEENAKRGAKQPKDDDRNRAEPSDASPARVYVVDCPPDQLARMLREVAALEKADVAVTRLESFAPLLDGDESWRFDDGRVKQAIGDAPRAPPVKAEFDGRRQPTESLAADPTAAGDHGGGDQKLGQSRKKDLSKSELRGFDAEDHVKSTGPTAPGNTAPHKGLAPDAAKAASLAPGGGGPTRAATMPPPPTAPGSLPADDNADSKKKQLESARQSNESENKQRENVQKKNGAAPAKLSGISPSGQTRFAVPAEGAANNADRPVAPSREAGQAPVPSKSVADKEVLGTTEKAPSQPGAPALYGASPPGVGTASRTATTVSRPTIVILRVNPAKPQPSR